MQSGSWHFHLGRMECVALADGWCRYRPGHLFAGAPPSEVENALRQHGWPTNAIDTPYTCLLVRDGDTWLLIDVGAGALVSATGWLSESLASAGVQPADITTILITHGHPGHVGGNLTPDGQPRYPNAHYILARAEWEYWNSDAVQSGMAAKFAHLFLKQMAPVMGNMTCIDYDTEIAPGVTAVLAPGHTPGHLAAWLRSEGQQLVHVSDAALHPLHLEHPEWQPVYDVQPELALATKRRLFAWAAVDRALVFAHHFAPFPNLGHVVKEGIGWRWQPVGDSGQQGEQQEWRRALR